MKFSIETLSGHNLKGDQCNEPNFGVRKFLDRVHVYVKFHEIERGPNFLLLIWYGMTLLSLYKSIFQFVVLYLQKFKASTIYQITRYRTRDSIIKLLFTQEQTQIHYITLKYKNQSK